MAEIPDNQRKPELIPMQLHDVPEKAKASLATKISWYTVSLLAANADDLKYIGSGVLCASGSHSGVLTARHVAECDALGRSAFLCISFVDQEHIFRIPREAIRIFSMGANPPNPAGPDIAFMRLPMTHVGQLKAKCCFVNLELNRERIKTDELTGLPSIYFVVGTPQQCVTEKHRRTFNRKIHTIRTENQCNIVQLEHAGEGYMDLKVGVTDWQGEVTETFKGVSGGGLWRTKFRTKMSTGEQNFDDPLLAGIAFWQSDENTEDDSRVIRCHDWRFLHGEFLTSLNNWIGDTFRE